MIERLRRSERTRPARERMLRWPDMVLCGTPASARDRRRQAVRLVSDEDLNTSSRVACAKAARQRMTSVLSICPEITTYGGRVNDVCPPSTAPPVKACRTGIILK